MTARILCGCHLEPCEDTDPQVDLCSEGTGMFDGHRWTIKYCNLHSNAKNLLDTLMRISREITLNRPNLKTLQVWSNTAIVKATRKLIKL